MIPAGGRVVTSGGHVIEGGCIFIYNGANGNATLTIETSSPFEIYGGKYYLAVFERVTEGATNEVALATINANGGVDIKALSVVTDYVSWETTVAAK